MKRRNRLSALLLAASFLAALLPAPPAQAADRVLLLEQAQSLAISNSRAISTKASQILLKQMKYTEAVEGIKAKIRNLRSFRWSPLLSFKFPQQLDLTAEYELNIKPLTLQAEIDILSHERDDLRYEAIEKASSLYVSVYILQEKISFSQARLEAAQLELARNQVRLSTGAADRADVEKMQKAVEKLTTALSNLKRSFEADKQSLSDMIGLDVTSGYTFRNPLKQVYIPREMLSSITEYTLANDQTFFTAKMAASTALMNLNAYESFMRNQYGNKMNLIQGYINMARQGQDIDSAAFLLQYRQMLKNLDKPWSFSIRILFFRFTMEWFKGEIDGTRYIEDEMYAVYTACMEYANAKRDRDTAERDLRQQVAGQFEQLVTVWNAYEDMARQVAQSKTIQDRVAALNQLGKAGYEELADARESYETLQMDAIDALADYNTLLYSFDRLTCGGITQYLKGASLSMDTGATGDSFAQIDPIEEPYYYIYTTVDNLTFHIGVSIPETYGLEVTGFEVWHGETQIGARTQLGDELRHLTLDYGGDSLLTIRLYNGSTYVDECDINAAVPRDVLKLKAGLPLAQPEPSREIGSFTLHRDNTGQIRTAAITLSLKPGLGCASYSFSYGTFGSVYSSQPQPLDQPFSYLSLLTASLEDLTLVLYSQAGEQVITARLDPETYKILQLEP